MDVELHVHGVLASKALTTAAEPPSEVDPAGESNGVCHQQITENQKFEKYTNNQRPMNGIPAKMS